MAAAADAGPSAPAGTDEAGEPRVKTTRTLVRGLAVLELLAGLKAGHGIGPGEIAETVGLDKATVLRLLGTLRSQGYVGTGQSAGTYRLTTKVMQLARGFGVEEEVRVAAHPHLVKLRDDCDEAVHLGILEGFEVIYIDKIESSRSIRLVSAIGQRMPLNTTSLGKAIWAALGDKRREELLRTVPLVSRTENSIIDREQLTRELEHVRRRGFAIDNGENEDGVTCVAAALHGAFDDVIGAISISGPTYRIGDVVDMLGQRCRMVSRAISAELTRRPQDRS